MNSNPSRLSTAPAVIVTLAIAIAAAYFWHQARAEVGPTPSDVKKKSSGFGQAFVLNETQWAGLKTDMARVTNFDTVLTAEGQLGVDDLVTVPVFSPYSGRVLTVLAQAGDMVYKGRPLLTMAASELAQARSDLAGATMAESTARRQWEQAAATEQRQHGLLAAEAAADKDWQQARTDLVAAENGYQAARAAASAAREKLAAMGVAAAPKANEPGSVASPIDGVVLQRQVVPGQFVGSLATGSSTPLFVISDTRRLWVSASVAETDAIRLRKGLELEVVPLGTPERHLNARISWIASTVDATTHRVNFRAPLTNTDGLLRPQMSVTVRVLDNSRAKALGVPRGAVMFDGAQALCYVVEGDRRLSARRIVTGRSQAGLIEVTQGLKEGERVVTQGTLFVDRAAEDEAS